MLVIRLVMYADVLHVDVLHAACACWGCLLAARDCVWYQKINLGFSSYCGIPNEYKNQLSAVINVLPLDD